MPLFRRKSEKLPKTSSLSLYGQGHVPAPPYNRENANDELSYPSDDRHQPFLAFAEVTYNPSLPVRSKSRLSKTLPDVLQDNAALAYFIQFLEAKRAKHLVKFWLEAESFRVSATTRQKSLSDTDEMFLKHNSFFSLLNNRSGAGYKFDSVFQNSSQSNCSLTHCDDKIPATNSSLCRNDTGTSDETSHSQTRVADCPEALTTVAKLIAQSEMSGDSVSGAAEDKAKEVVKSCEGCPEICNDNDSHLCDGIPCATTSCDLATAKSDAGAGVSNSYHEGEKPKVSLIRLHTSTEQDARSIYEKYIAHDALFPIGVSEELRNQITGCVFTSDRGIDSSCFLPAQQFVVKRMDEEYFPSFLRSSFHCKHQIDVLTSGNVYLSDVLFNDSSLFYFMEFMEQESVRHLVDFLLMADNFQKHLISQGTYDSNQAQNDAMIIYDKYFSLQATNPLGFSDSVRYEVEHNICRETGPLPDCFLKPVMILTQYIEKTSLQQFLNSQLYFKYISECIITIQSGGVDIDGQPKNSGSESGSEHSLPVSSGNTLLAMDGKQPGASSKVLKNIDDQDMRIDTGQFKPDSLWQRSLAGKLQIAGVDELGRVVTEFEPEPDRRRESRISKAVRKLVSREEDKNQEDMAWKIAEMIVKDICSVTMANYSEGKEEKGPS